MSVSTLRKEEIAEIARIATAEVFNQREAIMQEEFDSRYHDVKLLMKNYRMLKVINHNLRKNHRFDFLL